MGNSGVIFLAGQMPFLSPRQRHIEGVTRKKGFEAARFYNFKNEMYFILMTGVISISENMTNIVSAFEELKYSSKIIWMLQGTDFSLSVFLYVECFLLRLWFSYK